MSSWKNNILLTIDAVENELTNFPLAVHLFINTGKNNIDCSEIFDELVSEAFQGEITSITPIAHLTMNNISSSTLYDEKDNLKGAIYNLTQTFDSLFNYHLTIRTLNSVSKYVDISNITCSETWLKTTYETLQNNLVTYFKKFYVFDDYVQIENTTSKKASSYV